jgi:gamma-glutamyl-gamma-aminobutyrate hydrolase PuuD
VASNASDPPLIGLTTYVESARHGVWDDVSALLPMEYVSAVIRAGGTPVLLPPSPADPRSVLKVLSGVIVTGGPDVDPKLYGADAHPENDPPRPERDQWESAVCLAALEMDLPLLAICRGLQVLNVALGGTLHQHLPAITGSDNHRAVRGQMTPNTFTIEAGTVLAGILGTGADGMCHHHQGVDRLGRGMHAVARAGDGTIEAAEVEDRRFAVGVQWHPESNAGDDRLFKALVGAGIGQGGVGQGDIEQGDRSHQ